MLFSLSTLRTFETEIKATPPNLGPGAYEVTPVMGKHHHMKAPFGSRTARDLYPEPIDPPPPPGEYPAKPLPTNTAINHVFASESKRAIYPETATPGPGQYGELDDYKHPPPRELHHKPLRTASLMTGFVGQDVIGYHEDKHGRWRPLHPARKTRDWIGPGTYDPHAVHSARLISLEKSAARPLFGRLPDNPGPGTYSPSIVDDKLPVSISTLPRREPADSGTQTVLAPRPWVLPAAAASAAFRANSPRNPFPPAEETPPPAAYHRPARQAFQAGEGFGYRAERHFGAPPNDFPGPGLYDTRPGWLRGRHSALARAEARARSPADAPPGPGSYQLRATWGGGDARSHSVFASKSSREERRPDDLPAPDAYRPRILDRVGRVPPSIREARFARFGDWMDAAKEEVPSPDSYQAVTIAPGRGRTFATVTRGGGDREGFPGPGHYEVLHRPMLVPSLNARAKQARESV